MEPNNFNPNFNNAPNPMAGPNPMTGPNPMANPNPMMVPNPNPMSVQNQTMAQNFAVEPPMMSAPQNQAIPSQNPFDAAAGEILAQEQREQQSQIEQTPTAQENLAQSQASQPVPQPTAQTQSNAQNKKSFYTLLPIFILFLISFGAIAFSVAQYTRAENNLKRVNELQEQLDAANKSAADQISPLENEEITEKVENFFKLLRLSQTSTRESVLEYIGVNGFASTEKDDNGRIISPAKFSSVRNAMRKFATDGLANDWNIYRGLYNESGDLRYEPAAEGESNGVKYKDTVDTIKLIKADNLHYELSITTTTTKSDQITNEHTDVKSYDVYFIIDKDNKYVLNQIVENN